MFKAAPWLRRSVAYLSPLRPGFDPRPVSARVVVEKVALGQGFLRTLRFSLISIIPRMLHIHLHLHVALPEGQTGEAWEPLKSNALSEIREQWIEKYLIYFSRG